MEAAVELLITSLILCLAIVFSSLAHYYRPPPPTSIKVCDAGVARQTLIEQAVAFSNRPATPFPVPLITGRRRRSQRHGLTTVPYGPHWRALRSNLTATILRPGRQGLLAPLQQDAIDGLVAFLTGAGGEGVVSIRDSLYTAVFVMLARVCFGDDVNALRLRSIERMMQEFRVAIGEAKVFARSTVAKLAHWRKWRRFLAFRSRQDDRWRCSPLSSPPPGRGAAAKGLTLNRGSTTTTSTIMAAAFDLLTSTRSPTSASRPNGEDDPRVKRALTDDEMVSLMVEFLGAVESIVAILEWTLAHLVVTQPDVQAKLRHELVSDGGGGSTSTSTTTHLLHAVVLEILRLHPPFPMVMREVRSEGAVVGTETVPVPAAGGGTRVQFALGAIGRDERMWSDPDEFRPERFLPGGEGEGVRLVPAGGPKQIRMMPFGAGQRACPCAALGMQCIKGFLAGLVREFHWAPPPPPDGGGVDMTELPGFITVMESPLRAHITPRPRA